MPPLKMANMGKILVAGANGALGKTLIGILGPNVAVAGTRRKNWDTPSFDHLYLSKDGAMKTIDGRKFRAVINVAGRVNGNIDELTDANVSFPTKLAKAAREGGVKQFIQVSSFAVYGTAEYIDDGTPEVPANDYGRTKAEGDRLLQALATDDFSVASVRLPFLFDAERPALFRPLFKAARLLPYFPVASQPTRRSMISYADAAKALHKLAECRRSGIFHAAAPTLFDFETFSRLLNEELGFKLRLVCLPDVITNALKLGAPEVHRRLFQSSVLNPQINMIAGTEEITDLETSLRALIFQHSQFLK
jgi:UDP-glucose 4-epimerase